VLESFNGKLRDECLNANWFDTLDQARALTQSWRTGYSEHRPHSALGNVPPAQYVANLMEWASTQGCGVDPLGGPETGSGSDALRLR
jgi:putative transposase